MALGFSVYSALLSVSHSTLGGGPLNTYSNCHDSTGSMNHRHL